MYLSAAQTSDSEVVGFFGLLAVVLILGAMIGFIQIRKAQIKAGQEDALRQLVGRYEHLSATTLDAQQRVAADVAELRARTAAVEQILRTVE